MWNTTAARKKHGGRSFLEIMEEIILWDEWGHHCDQKMGYLCGQLPKSPGAIGLPTHKLRHTSATLMYKYGHVDIRPLQQILGHESIATTEIYTHIDDKQLHAAVNANPLAMMFT